MIFHSTSLRDLILIEIEAQADSRGSFGRTFCRGEFQARGLETDFVQCNSSANVRAGTLRGLHFQAPPHEEVKMVRCVRGRIYDVVVDLRADSPTFLRWQGFELGRGADSILYIPRGFAHGFQTLEDDSEVTYQISTAYAPGFADGVRYDDPLLGIAWPLPVAAISEKDRAWPSIAQRQGSASPSSFPLFSACYG
jgi:dTDP-4-dehydrorhamnose 3,5-epimerase